MIIKTVTFTGADEATQPIHLQSISKDYPYVEWGILLNKFIGGNNSRYPSIEWIKNLYTISNHSINLSGHICGNWCRDILRGNFTIFEDENFLKSMFSRFQLNFHDEKTNLDEIKMFQYISEDIQLREKKFIVQYDSTNQNTCERLISSLKNVYPLFDKSGGAGITPIKWPNPIGNYCGYAGGLGSHNLKEELDKISKICSDKQEIWIDFETYVRTNNIFDLKKVIECLKIVDLYKEKY